jgi:hypothetical protein
MSTELRIFLSRDAADEQTALDLQRQLALALQPASVEFWEGEQVPPEEYRIRAVSFIESADLFIALLSMNYEDRAETRFEYDYAIKQQLLRPALQISAVRARACDTPARLRSFPVLIPPPESIENLTIDRNRQLQRAAASAVRIIHSAPASNTIPVGHIELPVTIADLRERLLAQTDRINHAPLLALLKKLIQDVSARRLSLDIEDAFKHLREQMRLSQVSVPELEKETAPLQSDLRYLVGSLSEEQLAPDWRSIFIRDYYHFTPDSRDESKAPPFFIPGDDIMIPVSGASEDGDRAGLLSPAQQNDFRRNLLLARDALAVKNPALAFSYCDQVRRQIDAQSAQLYEYLLITCIQQETPTRAMETALEGNDRILQHILLFASRLRDYQSKGKCPSSTAGHNLAIASECISDAALRLYYHLPNDPIRHTGKHAGDVPDNRLKLRTILENTLKVCRIVHPSEELIEAAVIESCGGGKYNWIGNVSVVDGHFQFTPKGRYDLLGEIQELLYMLESMEAETAGKVVKSKAMLREDLFYSLLAKRQVLRNQLEEDERRNRPFTDVRESVVRFTYACLLGAHVFGDTDPLDHGNSFYRLALEYLLPGLLNVPPETEMATVRWFTLDDHGDLIPHPECAMYEFDALGIVHKIISHAAGEQAWLKIQPNLHETVYLEFIRDTEKNYEKVVRGLSYTDFRQMNQLDARRILIDCLRRRVIAQKARPERGMVFLEEALRELTGDGLLTWLAHNPHTLAADPDSIALGFDAHGALKYILDTMQDSGIPVSEEDIRAQIAINLFYKRILPEYEKIKKGDDRRRTDLELLMYEAVSNYKLYPETRYLDLVWRELTEEVKLDWIGITETGTDYNVSPSGFDAIAVLSALHDAQPALYDLAEARERIADRRYSDQVRLYHREISEFSDENLEPERRIAIDIIRHLKGIYLYYPKAEYLEIPWNELYDKAGKRRIRWNSAFLGFIPTNTDHHENHKYHFNLKFERYDLKRLLDNQYSEMQRVLRETGKII